MSKAPAIIKPERVVEATSHTGIEGYFEVELIHKPTGLVKQKLRFRNTITNAALEAIGTGAINTYIVGMWAAVGTGTTEPTVTDTALQTQVGGRTNSRGNPVIASTAGAELSYDYVWGKTTKVFFPGEATGNLTEVGLFFSQTGGTMFCRQLFRDGLGNPVTVVKTADDELRITYELRLYTMKNSSVTTATIKSVSTTCTTRGYDLDGDNRWWFPSQPESPSSLLYGLGLWGIRSDTTRIYASNTMPGLFSLQTGGGTSAASATLAAYGSLSYYRDMTYVWMPAAGTLTVGSIEWGGQAPFYSYLSPFITTFDPVFTKADTERLTFVARMSWGRV